MAFNLLKFLGLLNDGINVVELEDEIASWLQNEGANLPVKERIDALAKWLTDRLTEADDGLDVVALVGTIRGIAYDLVHGTHGVDPDVWLTGG